MRVAYFTAGSSGAGHLVRGIALGRGLARRGARVTFQMFGPWLPFAAAARDDYTVVRIDPAELRDPESARASALEGTLRDFAPDLLLVDCYWAPLVHLLPLPGCEAWLLARWLPASWFVGPADTRFDPSRYRRILAIEPRQVPGATDLVPPVVICNPGEEKPAGSLRRHLGVPDGQPLRVIAHAGVAGEAHALAVPGAPHALAGESGAGGSSPGSAPIVLSLHDAAALFPLAEWLGDADEISCFAGYNSYWEARWLGTWPRTRFSVLDRQRPEHEWRLRACGQVAMAANGADVIAKLITGGG